MVNTDTWALDLFFECADDCATAAEALAGVFEDAGALGWGELPVAPTGQEVLRVFFPATAGRAQVQKRVRRAAAVLKREGVLHAPPRLAVAAVETHDWVARFREGFRGVRAAPGLRVLPPWLAERRPAPHGVTDILIDPGMAFGTGLHESTRLCLRLLKREIRGGERVADVGAGSGILAIGAVRLGARSAVAIEVDPQAYANLAANIRLNRLGRKVRVFAGGLWEYLAARGRRRGFDLVVCNMLPERMRPLLGQFSRLAHRKQPTRVVVGGHLVAEREAVARAMAEAGIEISRRRRLAEWSAFVGFLR